MLILAIPISMARARSLGASPDARLASVENRGEIEFHCNFRSGAFAQSANLDNATVALEFDSGALGQPHSSMHAADLRRHNVMLAAEGRGITYPTPSYPKVKSPTRCSDSPPPVKPRWQSSPR
jgi:hypothetical protein